jgi:hypothetical protein
MARKSRVYDAESFRQSKLKVGALQWSLESAENALINAE